MTGFRDFVLAAVAAVTCVSVLPTVAEATCPPGQIGLRDGIGELCPGRIWDPAGFQLFQDVAYNPVRDEYLINTTTWDGVNGRSIATTLQPDGAVGNTTIEVSGAGINGVTAVAVEYNSVRNGYLAIWRLGQAPQQHYGRYLGADGNPISGVFPIGQGDPPSIAYSPDLDRYLVTWSKPISGTYYTYYAMIDGNPASATPVLQNYVLVDSGALGPVTAYNGTSQKFLIAFVKDFAPNPRRADVFGRTVTPAGAMGGVFPISTSNGDQQRPVLAASNTGFAVLYEDWNSGQAFPNAVGKLLDLNGGPLPVPISAGTTPKWELAGAITFNPATNSYFVAWRAAGNVGLPEHWVREFDPVTGAPLGDQILLTTVNATIHAAASRTSHLGPQAIVLWGQGAASGDGVRAGIVQVGPVAPPTPPADFSIWRTDGNWWTFDSGGGGVENILWGFVGDIPVPGDYTGDGIVDAAVFTPGGLWSIRKSEDGSLIQRTWGSQMGDVPVPMDYTGDGKVDIAIFRPNPGEWFILRSENQSLQYVKWGAVGDYPVPADYDGDGKVDVAVYRVSTQIWYVLQSATNTLFAPTCGAASDVPIPADYTGDGKADIAVFNTGNWWIRRSEDGSLIHRLWGSQMGDVAVPGDYTLDGKADIAIFRPFDGAMQGTWYVLRSQDNTLQFVNWGIATDIPVSSPMWWWYSIP